MTVERISLLRNIGQFDSVSAGAQMPLKKLHLIYAENGRGKTTLATILRSLGTGNSVLITERHRLGAQHAPHIVINANGQTYSFQDGGWSGNFPDIAVFDDNFVAQNVCSGIEIEADHKQNLHELILGAQGVALNTTLQTHIAKIEEHNRALKLSEAAIPAGIRGSLTVDAFCALPAKVNIDTEIQEADRNLAAARSADAIKQQANFLSFELPAFDMTEIEATLQCDLPGVQAEAASNVRQHLAKLGKGAEIWIGEGMQKIASVSIGEESEICPFCAQSLQGSSIIAHYESYFSESYASLKQTITDLGKMVAVSHNSEVQSAFERAIRLAIQTCEFWRKFMEVPGIEIDTAEIARAWKAAREPVLAILRAKLASPLEKMSLSPATHAAIAAYNSHRAAIEVASQALLSCNAKIAMVKERAAVANVAILSAELAKLKIIQARYNSSNEPLCQAYLDEKNAKKATEVLRDDARNSLNLYRANIFEKYEATINEYLTKFNAGFRLSRITSVNNRSGSSCTYNVLINNMTVPITAETGPSFKNTLSAGDRNTLALAFFFASLDQDQRLTQKIVVIDDPMTSLDEHRLLTTVQEMRRLYSRVSQIIVLSHSKPFLCALWEGADFLTRSAMRMARDGAGSTLAIWDVHQDCVTEHDRRHKLVSNYVRMGNPNEERAVAASLRPILEAFMRVAYPADFPPGTLLGPFHSLCVARLGKQNEILNHSDAAELRALLDYGNKFHHETNAAWQTEAINDQELAHFCSRTLRFAQRS